MTNYFPLINVGPQPNECSCAMKRMAALFNTDLICMIYISSVWSVRPICSRYDPELLMLTLTLKTFNFNPEQLAWKLILITLTLSGFCSGYRCH